MRVRHYQDSVNYLQFYTVDNKGSRCKIPAGDEAIEQYFSNSHRFNNNYNVFV